MVETKVTVFQILCAWLKLELSRSAVTLAQITVFAFWKWLFLCKWYFSKKYHLLRCYKHISHTRSVTVIGVREFSPFCVNKKLCCSNRPFFCNMIRHRGITTHHCATAAQCGRQYSVLHNVPSLVKEHDVSHHKQAIIKFSHSGTPQESSGNQQIIPCVQ